MALDFPNIPVDGQVYDNFYYDAVKGTWKSLSSGASPSILVNPTITNPTINNAVITATATTASTVPITVNGAASQTANLQDWKNSAGIVLADVDNLGNLQAPKLGLGGAVPPTSPSSTNLQVNGRAKILSNGAESAGIWLTGSNNVDTAFIGQTSPTTTDPVGIYHNGDWRFTVDSLGRVIMPFQPRFLATRSGNLTGYNPSNQTNVVVFNSTAFNVGNHYNTSTGRFTAPVAGIYSFWVGVLQSVNIDQLWVVRNGARERSFVLAAADGNRSGSFTIFLAANDNIGICSWSNGNTNVTIQENAFHTFFQGFLVG
jgi:hypothetical protein